MLVSFARVLPRHSHTIGVNTLRVRAPALPVQTRMVRPALASAPQHRAYSAATAKSEPVHVDQVLKKFYKKVHPDLFTAEPEKRAVNDKSFALLQGYLDLVRDPHSYKKDANEITSKFTLSFYTKEASKPVSLEVTVPESSTQQKQKERHLQSTLHNLFHLCKFSYEPFYVSKVGKEAERYARPGDLTLINFLLQTVAKLNPKTQKKSALQEKADIEAKMATYLQQQLEEVSAQYGIAKFAFNVRDHLFLPIQERITTRIGLVFRLKQALEDAQIEKGLTGLVISFTSKESGVDMNGNLGLNHKETTEQWVQHLTAYNKEEAAAFIEREQARTQLEKSITEMLNISSWSASPDLASDLLYRSLLNTTIGAIRRKNWNLPTATKDLKIRVEKVREVDYHPGSGVLIVPWQSTPRDIEECINLNYKQILSEKKQYQSNIEYVREKLGLKELSFLPYPELTFDQLHECVNRLNNHQGMVKPYTQGLKILIAHDYGFNPESGTVAIRWDYLVDKP